MKPYIDQIYNEGLGQSVYLPLKKLIDEKIKKKKANILITKSIKIIYLIFVLIVCIAFIYFNIPLK